MNMSLSITVSVFLTLSHTYLFITTISPCHIFTQICRIIHQLFPFLSLPLISCVSISKRHFPYGFLILFITLSFFTSCSHRILCICWHIKSVASDLCKDSDRHSLTYIPLDIALQLSIHFTGIDIIKQLQENFDTILIGNYIPAMSSAQQHMTRSIETYTLKTFFQIPNPLIEEIYLFTKGA